MLTVPLSPLPWPQQRRWKCKMTEELPRKFIAPDDRTPAYFVFHFNPNFFRLYLSPLSTSKWTQADEQAHTLTHIHGLRFWYDLIIVHCLSIISLGSFRLQSTCRYQRSREDVCPQHKATGHVSKYVNSRCAIENCLMSARNIRATAHAPCSQHTFNRNLELKTDQFHGVYRLVTPST